MEEERYITAKQAAKMLGVHPVTLYRWAKRGKIRYIKTPTGRLRYPISEIERMKSTYHARKNAVIYARVSNESLAKRGLLDKQVEVLAEYAKKKGYNIVETIKEVSQVGKRGIIRMINLAASGAIGKILVVGLDRLAPILSDLLRDIFKSFGVDIEVVEMRDPDLDMDRRTEIIDLLTEYLSRGRV